MLRFKVCLASLLLFTSLTAEESVMPWGKDAGLAEVRKCCREKKRCRTPLFGTFAEVAIGFHQKVISDADGPRSHFMPSSSQYTLESMRKYGFYCGFLMGCDRLMRENSDKWIYKETLDGYGDITKYDPVP